MAIGGAACAPPIGIRRVPERAVHRALTANVLSTGQPSAFSMQLLQRRNLVDEFRKHPEAALATLHASLGEKTARARRLFALSELSFAHAEHSGDRRYFLAAAVYAYAYLFPDRREDDPVPYDPRLRLAVDLYNRGITAGLTPPRASALDLAPRRLPLPFGTLEVAVDESGFDYGGYRLEDFVPVARFEVRGLRNRYRRPGIGAPLAAKVRAEGDAAAPWIGPRSKVPVTAFLRIEDPLRGLEEGRLHGRVELYTPDVADHVTIGGRTVPLECESSSSLAYRLEGSPLWDSEIAGFRSGDSPEFDRSKNHGLFMLHPYRPGLVPVVFVHGTASSPARWAEMANELENDPIIGERAQLWVFHYTTGNPIAYSASELREALRAAVAQIDPEGRDPALRRMVVIGHSQGGLLTKLTVVRSGDAFWNNVSKRPLAELGLQDDTRALLRRSLFVEPLPFVKRVVFIATPHRGSYHAERWFSGLAIRLVKLPGQLAQQGADMLQALQRDPDSVARLAMPRVPTSIDNMKASNPFIKTLAALPIVDGVTAHSIIPVLGDGPPENGNDGVVAYKSAHIDGVASELVVRSGHSTQATPETINEVRRILREHLAAASPE